MPETVTPSPAAPEQSTPAVPATPQIDSLETPSSAQSTATNRAAIQEKYTKMYGGASTPQPGAVTETPAQGSPTDPAATEVVASPDSEEVIPSTPPQAPDRLAQVEAQLAQLTRLLASQVKPPEPVAAPTKPVDPTFVELLQKGDFEGVERMLATKAANMAETSAVTKAVEMVRVENDVTNFINDLRGKNPDLLPLEELITAKAAQKLQAAQDSGQIRSVADYVANYKSAVNDAAAEARKILQSIRGAGKVEGQTRTREVISAAVIPPNAVDANRQAVQSPVLENPSDYIAKRQQMNDRIRGIAV